MQIPTSLAFLVSNGALGLTQTMLRLTNPVTIEEEDTASMAVKEGSNALAAEAAASKEQTATTATTGSPQPVPTTTLEEPPTGASLVRRIVVGVRVVRGPDWKWGDQVHFVGCLLLWNLHTMGALSPAYIFSFVISFSQL